GGKLTISGPGNYVLANAPLKLPMVDDGNIHSGVQGAWSFNTNFNEVQLSLLETGILFFQKKAFKPDDLNVFHYPLFRPRQGDSVINFAASFDINAGYDKTRTYFNFTDEVIASYLQDNLGTPVTLLPSVA